MKQKVIDAIKVELSMIESGNNDVNKHIYAIEKLLEVLKEGEVFEVPMHRIEAFEPVEKTAETEIKTESKTESNSIFDF